MDVHFAARGTANSSRAAQLHVRVHFTAKRAVNRTRVPFQPTSGQLPARPPYRPTAIAALSERRAVVLATDYVIVLRTDAVSSGCSAVHGRSRRRTLRWKSSVTRNDF